MNKLFCFIFVLGICSHSFAEKQLKVLASTYPVYYFTKIVTEGEKDVDVKLLLAASMGCPHDYAVTPHDLKKIAAADVLVINGLGMEEFLEALIDRANSKLAVVDSSEGIKNTLHYEGEEVGETRADKIERDGRHHQGENDHRHEHHHDVNPHLFASPNMTIKLTQNIASGLSKLKPESEARFRQNAERFSLRMKKLIIDFKNITKNLKNNRIVTEQGIFDYLARDVDLKVVAVIESHAGHEPSAAQMIKLVKTIKKRQARAIFTQPQYSLKVAQAIGQEANLRVATLDPMASGPLPVTLDHYEKIMRNNIKILEKTLGRQ